MKTVFKLETLAFTITLEQQSPKHFRVTYGKQVKSGLAYREAATDLGCCIMHALACDGKLDNSIDD